MRHDEKRIRDGATIRGCNGDDCDYCAGNRTHRDLVRRIAAEEHLMEHAR